MTSDSGLEALRAALAARFEDAATLRDLADADAAPEAATTLAGIAGRGSARHFTTEAVSGDLLRLLCAVALSAPTKSDLQQRDIVIVTDPALRAALNELVADQPWTATAPVLLVFCGNNRRQRLIHGWRGHPFANDHLDAFFNAACCSSSWLATTTSPGSVRDSPFSHVS
jgi:nitroreductase/FMN reductase [NAD(P)H]